MPGRPQAGGYAGSYGFAGSVMGEDQDAVAGSPCEFGDDFCIRLRIEMAETLIGGLVDFFNAVPAEPGNVPGEGA